MFLTAQEIGGQSREQNLTNAISREIRETFNSRSSVCSHVLVLLCVPFNQLSSRSSKKSVNTHTELAETFNSHFSTADKNLAAEIPNEKIAPESYIQPTQHRFSLKTPTANTDCKLLENINVRKATGLDGFPNNLLKFAAHKVAP